MSFKTVTVLGSTGSVGKSTLDILKFHKDKFRVQALTANKSADILVAQAIEFRPGLVAIGDENLYSQVKDALSPYHIKVVAGEEGILEAASARVDISIAAIMGMAGLKSVQVSLGNAHVLAIANKEPLVAAGKYLLDMAREKKTKILPLDSEHNAIFQVFEESNRDAIESLILTASGGPFREWSFEAMEKATPAQAVAHPNWSMGSKISVDSATMMNKALEMIEAHHLFAMPADKIEVLIHPQSVVHSMVAYRDGSVLAQLGAPDMRTPISYALGWPERIESSGAKLNWRELKSLDFYPPDLTIFPALAMAYECLNAVPAKSIILNAANEIAVAALLAGRIGFNDILRLVVKTLESHELPGINGFEDIIFFDKSVRERVKSYITN